MSVIHVGTVTSTNDVARQGLLDGAQHGTAWRADRQTAGRGRHGNDWVSREGDLFMSIALRPRLDAADLPLVTLAAAVGAQAAVASEGVDCGLKWPNDLINRCTIPKTCRQNLNSRNPNIHTTLIYPIYSNTVIY